MLHKFSDTFRQYLVDHGHKLIWPLPVGFQNIDTKLKGDFEIDWKEMYGPVHVVDYIPSTSSSTGRDKHDLSLSS